MLGVHIASMWWACLLAGDAAEAGGRTAVPWKEGTSTGSLALCQGAAWL